MTNSTTTRPQREKLARPSSKWRNLWRSTANGRYIDGDIAIAGEVVWAKRIWPSKEIAEAKAFEQMRQNLTKKWQPEYLGAYPE